MKYHNSGAKHVQDKLKKYVFFFKKTHQTGFLFAFWCQSIPRPPVDKTSSRTKGSQSVPVPNLDTRNLELCGWAHNEAHATGAAQLVTPPPTSPEKDKELQSRWRQYAWPEQVKRAIQGCETSIHMFVPIPQPHHLAEPVTLPSSCSSCLPSQSINGKEA